MHLRVSRVRTGRGAFEGRRGVGRRVQSGCEERGTHPERAAADDDAGLRLRMRLRLLLVVVNVGGRRGGRGAASRDGSHRGGAPGGFRPGGEDGADSRSRRRVSGQRRHLLSFPSLCVCGCVRRTGWNGGEIVNLSDPSRHYLR